MSWPKIPKSSEQDKLITEATMRGVVFGGEKFHRKINVSPN